MKKIFIILGNLSLVASIGFAQMDINTANNVGIGAQPNTKAKLLLSNLTAIANDTIFGLHSAVKSSVVNTAVHGAYFKNRLFDTGPDCGGSIYGVYLDNVAERYSHDICGVYANNVGSGYGSTIYGFYANNLTGSGYGGNAYGFKAINTSRGTFGSAYGIDITNKNTGSSGAAYGAYISSTGNSNVYGIYSIVSGVNAANTYSGYFTGGKVWINEKLYAWTTGTSVVQITSDERLKSDIKPLDKEMNKLYQLQGKSYKKSIVVADLQDSLSIALRAEHPQKPLEPIQEFGYLAQELQEIFPELVSKDDVTGYYAVNYIGLIPVIVEALKEQQKTNEAQQQKIDALEKTLSGCCTNANAETMKLYQNAPNPFNQHTTIKCYVPQNIRKVQLCVYTMQGVQVQCLSIAERGNVELQIEAGALSSGVYSYVLIGDGAASETKQMILTK